MWLLIKTELKYYKETFVVIGFLSVFYTLISLTAGHMFNDFVTRFPEIWTWTIGVTSFFLIITTILSQRFKETRDRYLIPIPLEIKKTALARIITIQFLPLAFILYFFFIHLLIIPSWKIYSIKLIGFISKGYVILPIVLILWDNWFRRSDNIVNKFATSIVIIILFAFSIIMLNRFVDPMLYSLLGERETSVALIWGSILGFVSIYTFIKRKSFLN